MFRFRLDAVGRSCCRAASTACSALARLAAVMSDLTPLFAVLVVLAATLATMSVWSPRRLGVKAGAVVVAFALMATTYAAMLDLLSGPSRRASNGG